MIQILELILLFALKSVESNSFQMPAYKLNGKPFIYYAGYDYHIGLYALPTSHAFFREKLSKYKQGKGSVQFLLDKNLPIDLIKEIICCKIEYCKITKKLKQVTEGKW